MNERMQVIESRLRAAFEVHAIEVINDSHLHAGHAGAREGGGHFRVNVVSPAFAGKGTLARHRLIYEALGDAMRPDYIHALGIKALTPDEASG